MPDIGMLGNSAAVHLPGTRIGPAEAALREIEFWRPFLRTFPDGERKFVHWCFWPSTVFTANAARDLTELFANNAQLQDIMRKTRIWASEEIILPTLTALLGYRIGVNPCSYDYVQYRVSYSLRQIEMAFDRHDVFWAHPIPRRYDDPLRRYIRERWNHYDAAQPHSPVHPAVMKNSDIPNLPLTIPVLERMRAIEGWLDDAEADLLLAAARRAVASVPEGAIVEIGSFCGRSTVVLADALNGFESSKGRKVYAIDPHDGVVGALDQGAQRLPPTRATFLQNIASAGVAHLVEPITQHSFEVEWSKPIGFLFVDGLHDYFNVARDFYHFERWLAPGAFVAFHDYADYYPGVKTFVDELLTRGDYEKVHQALSLILVWAKPNATRTALRLDGESAENPPMVYEAVPAPKLVVASAPMSCSSSAQSVAVTEAGLTGEPEAEQKTELGVKEDGGPGEPAQAMITAPSIVSGEPLVSCIMPTANRRVFVPRAIRYFQYQDYGKRELVILDDGDELVADLIPSDHRVRYVRMDHKATMGAKHNLACELAGGDIIVHWDDDDWMANWRISYQVDSLLAQPPHTLCGLAQMYFFDPFNDRAWVYTYVASDRPWVSGSTFCYRREFWESRRFPDMNEGADTVFVWGLRDAGVSAHAKYDFHIGVVHAANTSPKRTEDPAWHPIPVQTIYNLLETDQFFYQSLANNSVDATRIRTP